MDALVRRDNAAEHHITAAVDGRLKKRPLERATTGRRRYERNHDRCQALAGARVAIEARIDAEWQGEILEQEGKDHVPPDH